MYKIYVKKVIGSITNQEKLVFIITDGSKKRWSPFSGTNMSFTKKNGWHLLGEVDSLRHYTNKEYFLKHDLTNWSIDFADSSIMLNETYKNLLLKISRLTGFNIDKLIRTDFIDLSEIEIY